MDGNHQMAIVGGLAYAPSVKVLTGLPPAPSTLAPAPVVGMRIRFEIHHHAVIVPAVKPGLFLWGIGIYKTRWDDATGTWATQYLFQPNPVTGGQMFDLARRNWLWWKTGATFTSPAAYVANFAASDTIHPADRMDLVPDAVVEVTIESGEAVIYQLECNANLSTAGAIAVPLAIAHVERLF